MLGKQQEIQAKYLTALGGKEKIGSIQTLYTEMTTEKGQTQIGYQSTPNLALFILTDVASNKLVKVCNNGGITCLAEKNITGSDTSFRLQFVRPSNQTSPLFNPLVFYQENKAKISLLEQVSIEQKECYVIKLEKDPRFYELFYIEKATYRLLMCQKRYSSGPDGAQIYYSDYRFIDGVWFAFVEESSGSSLGSPKKVYTKIKVNVPIDKSIYVCPAM